MTFIMALLVLAQIAVGMVVNLYATIPTNHPGARSADYFAGSFRSVLWAISNSFPALVVHALVGLLLILIAIAVAVRAITLRTGRVALFLTVGASLVMGAAFNGASFLDFAGKNLNSVLMALFALGALGCYVAGLFLLPSPE
jgi:hypothetical protein